mgnify:CR=1 FL=1
MVFVYISADGCVIVFFVFVYISDDGCVILCVLLFILVLMGV